MKSAPQADAADFENASGLVQVSLSRGSNVFMLSGGRSWGNSNRDALIPCQEVRDLPNSSRSLAPSFASQIKSSLASLKHAICLAMPFVVTAHPDKAPMACRTVCGLQRHRLQPSCSTVMYTHMQIASVAIRYF